jgi:F-type H+-transporting ATPase subunit b
VQIDYFTVAAQIINFLVLVFLLQRFLYRPVIKAMDEREQRIASRIKEADEKRIEAEEEAVSLSERRRELEDKRQEMLAKATEEAQILKKELIGKANAEVEGSMSDWKESIERQRASMLTEMRLHVGETVYAISRRALQDLANEHLESQIINTFIHRLQEMEDDENGKIKEFYRTPGQMITIRSTFEIAEDQRQRIFEAMKIHTGLNSKIKFEIAPELISGVEIRAPGLRTGWSIASYLDSLKEDLSQVHPSGGTGEGLEGGKGDGRQRSP